ncbi:MAG TPA: hypothetical protein VGQ46_09415 [Thermoanaerobaculia bacterium]|jgi:hypothetical protein|nr:hypothetical protein [Thermoanaerobaculia bacterium]
MPDEAEPVTDTHSSTSTKPQYDVFASAQLLTTLYIHQAELGYKLVTFYTASATMYVARAGFTAQQYFASVGSRPGTARNVAFFGLLISLLSLAAPFGLGISLRQIERQANRYSESLGLPSEKFTVIRFGMWVSLIAFAAITVGWSYLLR